MPNQNPKRSKVPFNGGSLVAIAIALAAAACSQAKSENAATVSSASTLPCDIGDVLQRNCQSCHSATPKFGAPMPLVTYANTQAVAKSDPSKKVVELMAGRIHDAVHPMPPVDALSAADTATLDAWFKAGATEGAATASCDASLDAGTTTPSVGPSSLPCPASEQTVFRAHGDAVDAPFHVEENAGNLYQCFSWKAPWTNTVQATSFAPVIDDARVVHHWILYETATPQPEGVGRACQMPADATFLQGWAPGGQNNVFPSDIGLRLPTSEKWLILQVHYWNVARLTDANDRSGVAMCTTPPNALRPKTAVVSTLGSLNIALPARSTNVDVVGKCTPEIAEPMHVLSAGPHMHTLGQKIKTEVLRGGQASTTETLVDVPRWDFNAQASHAVDMVINPGDVLKTTCTYSNGTDKAVYFGEKTENEMCFDFVTVWPAPGLTTTGGRKTGRCIDP